MKFSTAILSTLSAFCLLNQKVSAINCATSSTIMTLSSYSITPYPLCIGKDLCNTATGVLSEPITNGARLSIVGRYLNTIVYSDEKDLCALMAAAGMPCPIPATLASLPTCYLIKSSMPANVPVAMTWKAVNGDFKVIYCESQTVQAVVCS
ncbi:hypothetical protein FBU30_007836 [Linnemannia zychae]|nr:hypothetical protein FBU30_007836 [Linnemannia zychae]